MQRNTYSVIDGDSEMRELIDPCPEIYVDMDSGFVSMREPNDNDNLNFN